VLLAAARLSEQLFGAALVCDAYAAPRGAYVALQLLALAQDARRLAGIPEEG
jgi:hypothetical protein